MSALGERAARVRVAHDAAFCSGCFTGAQEGVRFVDFDAALDRGSVVTDMGALVGTLDDLYLCEACVRAGMEALALRPQASANQLREIRRLERELDAVRSYARDLEATLAKRPELGKGK